MRDRVHCIVDTDAGPDDLMAIAFLLASPAARIEAITTAYGLAHTKQAARNILRVLALFGRTDIPVYVGQDRPSSGTAAFPDTWRRLSDTLPGISLPRVPFRTQGLPATEFLLNRTRDATNPVTILALGALTNLVELGRTPHPGLEKVVIMGGAFNVAGNVINAGNFISPTQEAEWNMFVDPLAAHTVFASDIDQLVIPLDATNHVQITPNFIDAFATLNSSPGHRLVSELFSLVYPYTAKGSYYAWDPLAAVALLCPAVVSTRRHAISVSPKFGTTCFSTTGPLKSVAYSADAAHWKRVFCGAFA